MEEKHDFKNNSGYIVCAKCNYVKYSPEHDICENLNKKEFSNKIKCL